MREVRRLAARLLRHAAARVDPNMDTAPMAAPPAWTASWAGDQLAALPEPFYGPKCTVHAVINCSRCYGPHTLGALCEAHGVRHCRICGYG